MTKFKEITDDSGKVTKIATPLFGKDLLMARQLNKGSAFNHEEREMFGLTGKLPYHVDTMKEQLARYYQMYQQQPDDLSKNVFLNALKQNNEVLFYRLAKDHLSEMLPIVYTPTIGDAVEAFSYEFNQPTGLYFAYPNRDRFDEILANRITEEIDLVIVTDGEGVLGIGDWGVGGMDILVGKLMVYTLCGGINPRRVLPIMLDAGTNNEDLLNDPMYVGWRHKRVEGKDYDEFIDLAVSAIRKAFPNIFLHWEDFGRENARKNLNRYRDKMCTFNDDMQGTGATALGSILAGLRAIDADLSQQQFVFFGAGTAGAGIADQIFQAMLDQGASEQQARKNFWLIDRQGVLFDDMDNLVDFQKPYAHKREDIKDWQVADPNNITLLDVVNNTTINVLVGTSTVHGAFNKEVVQTMAAKTKHPVIMPLSNPTSKSEAEAKDLLEWTNGKALIATGSPFAPVEYSGKSIRISQCNNAFIFPGLGLGIIASKAQRVTDGMIRAASIELSKNSPAIKDKSAPVLPDFDVVSEVSRAIALAVAEQARKEGVAGVDNTLDLKKKIETIYWEPQYLPYIKE